MTVSFSGCFEDDGKDYIFKYDIAGNPRTLDPQTANDASGLELIANIFDGLLRLDDEGNVECAVAESYTVSEDGLTYRFKLRNDVYWYDGEEFEQVCTAEDFVFAFRRLFKPSTKSPSAGSFFCIKNSEAVNRGTLTDLSQLGVRATGEFELEITLQYPNPMLPVLLTTAPAMPCNEEFYNSTEGKYGLYADKIASNGSFFVYSWYYDQWSSENNNLILRRNDKNNADKSICPYGLNFFIDEADSYTNFVNEKSHVYVAEGNEAINLLNSGYSYSKSDNTVWGIAFNIGKNGVFSNESLRKALAHCTDRDSAVLSATGYVKAESFVPDSIQVGSLNYRESAGEESALAYNTALAKAELDVALTSVSRSDLEGITIIVPNNDTLISYLSYITQKWQSELGFYCNVKALDAVAYEAAVKNGNFEMALVSVSGSFNSPSAYLSSYKKNDSLNYFGYTDSGFDELVTQAERAETEEKSAELYFEAEKTITDSALFIPLCYQSGYAFFGDKCKDISYNPFTKIVTFRTAKRFA